MEKLSAKELRHTLNWLLEVALCPVCHETLMPTVVQCVRGHPVCVSCRQDMHTPECPLCRDVFSNVQHSAFIQQVLEALPHPCRHQDCEHFVKTKDNHEKFCPYKFTQCHYCDWSGAGKEILNHLKGEHLGLVRKYLAQETPKTQPTGMPFNPVEEVSAFTPIIVDGHFFWGEMKNEPEAGRLTAIFHPVPLGKSTSAFRASVKLSLQGSYRANIKLNTDPDADAYVENCISIPTSILHKFTKANKFDYRITVDKIRLESMYNFVQAKLELLKR